MPFDFQRFWASETGEHLAVARSTFEALEGPFGQWLDVCESAVRAGGKILFFGNGGSAADAQHLATELAVRYVADRAPIAAIALTTDTSALTAIGNDMGFEQLFARQVAALGRPGDLAIGITTSGRSRNVLLGLAEARRLGLRTAGFGGRGGGELPAHCDVALIVPSDVTARIQELHITLGQMLCGALEQRLGLVRPAGAPP